MTVVPTVVTGATGQLGRLTVEALLRRGIPAVDIIATGRDIARIKDLAVQGIRGGADRLLLISASVPVGERAPTTAA